MIEECGPPTVFVSLSPADLYWPKLYRILDPYYDHDSIDRNSGSMRKLKLLSSNPLIVAYFFYKRVVYFMDYFFKKFLKVKLIWYRIEFQHIGSPHMHGLFWFENAPDLTNFTSDDSDKIRETIEYFDEFISIW